MRRLVISVPLLFVVSTLSFVLVALEPGDPAREILGLSAPQTAVIQLRRSLGLDQPLWARYWHWLTHAVHGDFGVSAATYEPVGRAISERLPVSLSLIAGALLLTTLIGLSLGILGAVRGGPTGRFVDGLALIGLALPSFWVAAALIEICAVEVRWFPASGYVPFGQSPWEWFRSLVLPVTSLALFTSAMIAKQTRAGMLDALSSEYVRSARANGIGERAIIFRHGLRNASLPVLTQLGLLTVGLLTGTVFVETVFAIPGIGQLAVNGVTQHDLAVVQGTVVLFTVIIIAVNLAIDILYTILDPRVRAG
ncbi:MAG TPA: ABC transporter permease [Chloroflexota bacterium]